VSFRVKLSEEVFEYIFCYQPFFVASEWDEARPQVDR